MDTIQFTYGNFRYLVFEREGQYYLLDRSPSYFIAYLFSPISWLFYQKIYLITQEGYSKIQQKNDRAKKFVLPASFGAGLGVFVYNWFRFKKIDISIYFKTTFSFEINLILLLLSLILSYTLAKLFYVYRKKNIISLLGTELRHPQYMKLKPQKIDFKQLIGYVAVMGGLILFMAVCYLYSANLLFCLITIALSFIYFIGSNIAFGTEVNQFYKIVDIKKDS
ncbi:DUF443 family protein [Streptococcus macacae]|uniref:Tandem five-TM protein n=1 Tax=Streptococcus macacae NCTC 11558 TaxID=764298 RepID=G5JX76_9STRE|nr:DUF443 family protein [Streptococcus macacae]EHJ52270.1 hypothetical protein STRMA_1945 [Streptococcus macacae NCTC 11558]SUN77849.1 tandem five-TM protein [Streptococcus macacae NCTC 11558]